MPERTVLDFSPPSATVETRCLRTPLATVAKPLSLAFFARSKSAKKHGCKAGSGLIEYPKGEYARRSQAVLSSRPFPLGDAREIRKLARCLMSDSSSPYNKTGFFVACQAAIVALCNSHPRGDEILELAERIRTGEQEYDRFEVRQMFGVQENEREENDYVLQ